MRIGPMLLILVAVIAGFMLSGGKDFDIPDGETVLLEESASDEVESESDKDNDMNSESANSQAEPKSSIAKNRSSVREVFVTDGVKHSVPLDEIRQGCYGRDCIPSVDEPEFVTVAAAREILSDDAIGIGLTHKGESRFYPFDMLVTREIVNDTIAGEPVLVTYCPLCGTGVVFERRAGDKVYEFGVSGMLWQSNLLMYNRAEGEDNISLWSQVLGEAVFGTHTGTKLAHISSDVVKFSDWADSNPATKVLNTGRVGDPYGGRYFDVAKSFSPDFNEADSPLSPMEYVSGLEIDGEFKAYPHSALVVGETTDMFAGQHIIITKGKNGTIEFRARSGGDFAAVNGFWFSWVAAHPDSELYGSE